MDEGNPVARNEAGFFNRITALAEHVRTLSSLVVIHHYDADGLSSGSIVIQALRREGKEVTSLCLKQLYTENLAEIRARGSKYLFVDFGSGQADYLTKEFGEENTFILDHHQVVHKDGVVFDYPWNVNPLIFGIDGGGEISGSGIAYFFARALHKNNVDLAGLAIVGAVGDMQDSHGALVGLNRTILADAESAGVLSIKKDLRLYGRISRPLLQFLLFSSSPVLPDLTAKEENCNAFLHELEIPLKDTKSDRWLSYQDLSEIHKKKLASALISHLYSYNTPEWKIQEMIGEVYTLENEMTHSPLRDAKEFATALNSTGRHAEPEIGLAVCLGDRNIDGAYGKLLILITEHRTALAKGIQYVTEHGVEEKSSYYFFDAGSEIQDSLVGIVAGMLYGSVLETNKPIIALAKNEDGTLKLSGRGTSELVRNGLNLGKAFKDISTQLEGVQGGGHKIAAGCKFPENKKEEFLSLLETELAIQLKEYFIQKK